MDYIYNNQTMTEETKKLMAEVDREIAGLRAMQAHDQAVLKMLQEIISPVKAVKDTWLVRQLKNMRVDAQLAGQAHEADVLTQAISELGGTL